MADSKPPAYRPGAVDAAADGKENIDEEEQQQVAISAVGPSSSDAAPINAGQLYAPPEARGTAGPSEPKTTGNERPWPSDDTSLPPRAIYGFAVNPVRHSRKNTPLDSIHVTDPNGDWLFHFRWTGTIDRKSKLGKSGFVALVRGPQARPNKTKGPDLPWEKGLTEEDDWVWKYDVASKSMFASGSAGGTPKGPLYINSMVRGGGHAPGLSPRSFVEFDDGTGTGGELRWVCSSWLSWTGTKRWDVEEFRLHRPGSETVLAKFSFRPTHILTFYDTETVDQTLAIFALGYLIRRSWGVMYGWPLYTNDVSGFDSDSEAYFYDVDLLRQHASALGLAAPAPAASESKQ